MNDIKIIIQARTGSTRLPQKMILPFYENEGIFSLILKRLTSNIENDKIVLATSDNPNNDVLEEISRHYGVFCYRGSENDVLQRFIDAANATRTDKIIRVCADNPFLDINSLKTLVEKFSNTECDYLGFSTSTGWPTIKTHYGFWAEAVTLKALEKASAMTNESLYHEHVTNFIYGNPEKFNVNFIKIPIEIEEHDDIRLTIDTKIDFDIQKEIFENIYKTNESFDLNDVVNYLVENQRYFEIMKNEIRKNQK